MAVFAGSIRCFSNTEYTWHDLYLQSDSVAVEALLVILTLVKVRCSGIVSCIVL